MRHLRHCAVAALCMLHSIFAAEPPKIDALFPAGGQRGTTVECKVTGGAGDGTLQVWTKSGQLSLEFSEKKDSAKVAIPADADPRVHWLRFSNEHGATDLRPFVVGLIEEVLETEPNNQLSESEVINLSATTVNGVLEKSEDVDMFAFKLTAGQTLVASVAANSILGSPMDAVLQLLDDHGTVMAQNDDDHGFDPQIVYNATSDGVYHLRLFAFPSAPNSTIKLAAAATYVYRLTITTGPFVDYTMPAAVNADADKSVVVSGWNLQEASAMVQPTPEGVVVLAKEAALAVSVETVSDTSLIETPGALQQLEVPSAMTGVISASREKDVYTLAGKAKQNLTITVAGRSLYSQLDPVVTVTSADGKVIKESDDRNGKDLDSEASFTIPADGEYRVTVTDRFGAGGERYFYLVTTKETLPDFSATLKANQFVLPDEKPLEIPVTIARMNGFAEKIDFKIEGLPDGVECKAVVSEEKGDSQKSVTLKLIRKDDAAAFSGVVHVTGTGQSSRQHAAEAPIQNSVRLTSEVWLTVVAKEPQVASEPSQTTR